MADCIEDQFIATRYAKIGQDEGFHSKIGAKKLAVLCDNAETQARAEALAHEIRCDLFKISALSTLKLFFNIQDFKISFTTFSRFQDLYFRTFFKIQP